MIDSTDIERLEIAADELKSMLNEDELKDAALLVFANKQDQAGTISYRLPPRLTKRSPAHKGQERSRKL